MCGSSGHLKAQKATPNTGRPTTCMLFWIGRARLVQRTNLSLRNFVTPNDSLNGLIGLSLNARKFYILHSGQKNNLLVPFCKNNSLERLCTNKVPVIYNSLKDIQKSDHKQSTPQAFYSDCINSYNNFICLRKNCYSCRRQFTW